MKDLLSIKDLGNKGAILNLLDLADKIKKNPHEYYKRLAHKCIILIFEKTSTRTRISFENGMYQLGGNAIYLDWRTSNFHLGALEDEIKCISSYVDLIMARVNQHKTLKLMKNYSSVPIINGLSDKYHPCQALSDLMTIREHFRNFTNLQVSFIGDGNNVCNSLIVGCILLGISITVATPEHYKPHSEVLDWVKHSKNANLFEWTSNPVDAVKEANVIYTDTFVSMGQESEKEQRMEAFKSFQINTELLTACEEDYVIMHCLPAHRGVEITDNVIESPQSIIFRQAENRIYLQKALMVQILGQNP